MNNRVWTEEEQREELSKHRHQFVDLTGMKFGRLTVLQQVPTEKYKASKWICRCECGNFITTKGPHLRSGVTKSCGCYQREQSRKHRDLSGLQFGNLTVIKEVEKPKHIKSIYGHYWLCRCKCGNETIVDTSSLTRTHGSVKSCGCLARQITSEYMRKKKTTHGMTGSRLYNIWAGMKARCYNPACKEYPLYGRRGIRMCPEWKESFEEFCKWALPAGYDETAKRGQCTLDRIDVNGNYCPENCRWVDQKTQCNNTRKNRRITCNGETHTISEWSDITGLSQGTICDRLKYGWSIQEVLFRPRRIWPSVEATKKEIQNQRVMDSSKA